MAQTETDVAAEPGGGEEPGWGRMLDWAGAVAAVILAAILVDIWTDGRLISRRLRGRGGGDDERGDAQPPG